jgi:hypothetical protein
MPEGSQGMIEIVEPYGSEYSSRSPPSTVRSHHTIYSICQNKYTLHLYSIYANISILYIYMVRSLDVTTMLSNLHTKVQ